MNSLKSLSELFDKKIFRIPDYQRGYAWGHRQLEDFWEDIDNLTPDRNHYIGMLSLKEVKEDVYSKWEDAHWIIREKRYRAYHVVDGQQRLTTFVIFLNSLLKFAESKEINYLTGDSLEQIKSRYIVETKLPDEILKAYKFGYEIDNPSFSYLRYHILGESAPSETQETFYTLNLEYAKNYFDKQIEEFFDKNGIEGFETLYNKLVNNLQFNIHDIADDFDVFIAFETMNNRGKKLSNLEILKNRLIYLSTIYDDFVLDKYSKDQLRKNINDAWKEVYFQLGRNKEFPLNDDVYLKNHWTLFFKYSRNKGDDYIKFLLSQHFTPKAVFGLKREVILDEDIEYDYDDEDIKEEKIVEVYEGKLQPIDIKNYIESLKSISKYWYYSYNPEESGSIMNEEEKKWVNKLNRVGINYFRTMVVASFANPKINSLDRIRLFKVIEKTIFLFFRMGQYRSNWRSSETYNRARELLKDEVSVEDVISELQESFDNNISGAVGSFINRMTALFKNYDGYYSWNSRSYFFFEYEMSLSEKTFVVKINDWRAFTKNAKDHISIEHIYPQQANHFYWQNHFRDYSNEEKKALTNSLGNLLALSQSKNSSLQNDEYYDKRDGNNKRKIGYNNGSNSEIEVAINYPDWTPDAIKKRGLHLISFMEERWGFKFESYEDKLKVLGIDFMNEEREKSPELSGSLHNTRNRDITDYLNNYRQDMVNLYTKLISIVSSKIEGIKEELSVNKEWIEVKNKNDKTICQVMFFKKIRRVKIQLIMPKNDELKEFGEFDQYAPIYNFRFYLKSDEDIKILVALIEDANAQINNGELD